MTETIVVGYDGSRAAEKALAQAVREAQRRSGSRILIACGHQQPFGWLGFGGLGALDAQSRKYWEQLVDRIAAELEAAAAGVREAGIDCSTTCSDAQPAEILLDAARATDASLIVIGARGAGEAGALGSTTSRLLQQARTPVLVVPD